MADASSLRTLEDRLTVWEKRLASLQTACARDVASLTAGRSPGRARRIVGVGSDPDSLRADATHCPEEKAYTTTQEEAELEEARQLWHTTADSRIRQSYGSPHALSSRPGVLSPVEDASTAFSLSICGMDGVSPFSAAGHSAPHVGSPLVLRHPVPVPPPGEPQFTSWSEFHVMPEARTRGAVALPRTGTSSPDASLLTPSPVPPPPTSIVSPHQSASGAVVVTPSPQPPFVPDMSAIAASGGAFMSVSTPTPAPLPPHLLPRSLVGKLSVASTAPDIRLPTLHSDARQLSLADIADADDTAGSSSASVTVGATNLHPRPLSSTSDHAPVPSLPSSIPPVGPPTLAFASELESHTPRVSVPTHASLASPLPNPHGDDAAIPAYVLTRMHGHGEAPAIVTPSHTLSYKRFTTLVRLGAAGLSRHGLHKVGVTVAFVFACVVVCRMLERRRVSCFSSLGDGSYCVPLLLLGWLCNARCITPHSCLYICVFLSPPPSPPGRRGVCATAQHPPDARVCHGGHCSGGGGVCGRAHRPADVIICRPPVPLRTLCARPPSCGHHHTRRRR